MVTAPSHALVVWLHTQPVAYKAYTGKMRNPESIDCLQDASSGITQLNNMCNVNIQLPGYS